MDATARRSPMNAPIVFIVDDDDAVRAAFSLLLSAWGWRTLAYESAQAFSDHYDGNDWGCLILDLQMPGMSGVALQELLIQTDRTLPVVIVTAQPHDPLAQQAQAKGAVEILAKPVAEETLIAAITRALALGPEEQL